MIGWKHMMETIGKTNVILLATILFFPMKNIRRIMLSFLRYVYSFFIMRLIIGMFYILIFLSCFKTFHNLIENFYSILLFVYIIVLRIIYLKNILHIIRHPRLVLDVFLILFSIVNSLVKLDKIKEIFSNPKYISSLIESNNVLRKTIEKIYFPDYYEALYFRLSIILTGMSIRILILNSSIKDTSNNVKITEKGVVEEYRTNIEEKNNIIELLEDEILFLEGKVEELEDTVVVLAKKKCLEKS